jgi:hypothetical protein
MPIYSNDDPLKDKQQQPAVKQKEPPAKTDGPFVMR